MRLESCGILISLRPFNERDAIARIFTRDFGVLVGMMRGALVARKNKPLVGQCGNVVWGARLDSQLGLFHWDAEKNLAAGLMLDNKKLACMNAAFELLGMLLPERQGYATLYNETIKMMVELAAGDLNAYLQWEICLLAELGYALDLSKCSGCGVGHDLNYLSPRTGRAVCNVCAQPYINKLYKLPLDVNITLHFLDSICAQQGVNVPIMRRMLNLV